MILKTVACLIVYFTCLPSGLKGQFQFNLDSVIGELNRNGYDSVFVFIPKEWHGYDMNVPVRYDPIGECPPSEFLITSVGDTYIRNQRLITLNTLKQCLALAMALRNVYFLKTRIGYVS